MRNKRGTFSEIIAGLLRWTTITFIALRAADVISWPWYALLSPIFGYIVFFFICAAVVGIAETIE